MTKPVNPNISIPAAFAVDGQKTDFTNEKIQNGFDPVDPDVLAGDNLNKFIDDTYKGLNYSIDGVTDLYDVTDDLKDLSNLSATGQAVIDGKASTDLSNLTTTGEAHFANPSLSNLNTTGESRLHALKGYEDAGELLTDSEGLSDVKNYAHSSFDLSKFTVVGSPTITDDGIASGFSSSNYILVNNTGIDNTVGSWKIISAFTTNLTGNTQDIWCEKVSNIAQCYVRIDASNKLRIHLMADDSTTIINYRLSSTVLSNNTNYLVETIYNGTTYQVLLTNLSTGVTTTEASATSAKKIRDMSTLSIGVRGTVTPDNTFAGSIDLKQFSITIDGVTVFSGNKTGIDTYTIDNSTVTIPYTLSKTGSKIVDSAYRTDVASVYSAFGIAPYYTLSDSDFTVPQGELYGMIQKSAYYYLPDWNNVITLQTNSTTLVTDYSAPANGYMVCSCGSVAGSNLNFSINGTCDFAVAGSTGNGAGTVTILVNKGDTYSETLSTGATNPLHTVYFIPTKGV